MMDIQPHSEMKNIIIQNTNSCDGGLSSGCVSECVSDDSLCVIIGAEFPCQNKIASENLDALFLNPHDTLDDGTTPICSTLNSKPTIIPNQQTFDLSEMPQLFPFHLPCFLSQSSSDIPLTIPSDISQSTSGTSDDLQPTHSYTAHLEHSSQAPHAAPSLHSFETNFAMNLQNFQTLASQYLVLQTQQIIAQQLSEFGEEAIASYPIAAAAVNTDDDKCMPKHCAGQQVKDLYVCGVDGCNREYASLSAVQKHQSNHNKSVAYHCKVRGCVRSFSKSCNLKYHMLTHTNDKRFCCVSEGCSECFYTSQQLDVHSRSHTQRRPFVCDVVGCISAFTTAGNLRNHQRIHSGDKPFVCEECGKRFTERNTLKKHSVVHSGTRPFPCDLCERSFTQSSSRRYHMAKKHGR